MDSVVHFYHDLSLRVRRHTSRTRTLQPYLVYLYSYREQSIDGTYARWVCTVHGAGIARLSARCYRAVDHVVGRICGYMMCTISFSYGSVATISLSYTHSGSSHRALPTRPSSLAGAITTSYDRPSAREHHAPAPSCRSSTRATSRDSCCSTTSQRCEASQRIHLLSLAPRAWSSRVARAVDASSSKWC